MNDFIQRQNKYVVRDFDAHAWVEAYYPNWGWLTFDPTPADSPARSQPLDARPTGGNLGSQHSDIFAFVILILTLTVRPSGLLGERVADRA